MKNSGRADGRWVTLVLLLAGALAVTWLVQSRGWSRGWRTWGVATGEVSWLDLRVVAGAAQTRSEGGDPYVSNPHDPMGRPFNYPSLWLALFPATGSVAVLAGGAAVVAAGVALLATGPTTGLAGGVIGLLLLSPALVLGVERGNTDLIVFALVGAGAALLGRSRGVGAYAGVGLLVLASLLKIYPVVALTMAAWWATPRVRSAALVGLAGCAGWFAWHWAETVVAVGNTQIGAIHSYGRAVLPFALELRERSLGRAGGGEGFALVVNVAAAAGIFCAAWGGRRLAATENGVATPAGESARLGWLIGGGIFLATFAAGSSFSYRLWFLVLGVPWLLATAARKDESGWWARVALGGLLLLAFGSGVWDLRLFWLGQGGGWMLFVAGGGLWVSALVGPRRVGI